MDARRIPVLQSFKISTPSVTVTVTSDDTPLPDGAPVLSAPGNLVTVTSPGKGVERHTTTAASVPVTPRGHLAAADDTARTEGKVSRLVMSPQFELGVMGEFESQQSGDGAADSRSPPLIWRPTMTTLRRWDTYKGQQFEDTPFLGREVQLDVPIEAYGQGHYFKETGAWKRRGKIFGPLKTETYVVPPRFVRPARKGFLARICDCCPA